MSRSLFPPATHLTSSMAREWPNLVPTTVFAIAAAYLCLYVFAQWLSYARPAMALGITPWHPQAGLAVALLLFLGSRWLTVVALSALLAGVIARPDQISLPALIASSVWIAGTYAATAEFLRRWGLAQPLGTTRGAARMAATMVVGSLIVAAGYVGIFVLAGDLPPNDAVQATARYWVGDLSGVLTLTPLLLHAPRWRELPRAVKGHKLEVAAQIVTTALTFWTIFALPAADQLRFFYLLFVPIIWVAIRWSLPGALLGVLAIQIGLVVATHLEIPAPRFIDLQFLLLTLSLTALLLGAAVTELAGREAEQRALLTMAPDGIVTVNDHGVIQVANPAAQRLFARDGTFEQPRTLHELLPDLRLASPQGRETLQGQRNDGSAFPAEIAWARLDPPANAGFLVTVRDASERHRAQEQLRERDAALARAMRFAVAGELASALAHELNQPITALVSYLRASEILAGKAPGDDDRLASTLSKAAHEAMRASEVMGRLRDFYRGGTLNQETVHLPTIFEATARAFQERLRRLDASISISIDPNVPEILGDVTQLEIVLHNLVGNALDSLSHSPPDRRTIELRASCAQRMMTIHVEDSGPGVNAEVAGNLFEPFVTSKTDGMGLGLAISRSLVLSRGGELSFSPGTRLGGALFTILLPLDVPQDATLV